jgi:hypothetical protein
MLLEMLFWTLTAPYSHRRAVAVDVDACIG